jgi:hypothetical protein
MSTDSGKQPKNPFAKIVKQMTSTANKILPSALTSRGAEYDEAISHQYTSPTERSPARRMQSFHLPSEANGYHANWMSKKWFLKERGKVKGLWQSKFVELRKDALYIYKDDKVCERGRVQSKRHRYDSDLNIYRTVFSMLFFYSRLRTIV